MNELQNIERDVNSKTEYLQQVGLEISKGLRNNGISHDTNNDYSNDRQTRPQPSREQRSDHSVSSQVMTALCWWTGWL